MSILSLKDVTKSFGGARVLDGVSFALNHGERIGLLGVNGSGKTTLLKIIEGSVSPDTGDVALAKGLSVGRLAQVHDDSGGGTLIEVMMTARPEVQTTKLALEAASERLERLATAGGPGYDAALAEYTRISDEFEMLGGYTYENEVNGALVGLGFDADEFMRDASTLSGGERTRLELARLLVGRHGLLLLDEPTNHLDVGSIDWLEGFFSGYVGTVLLVSHDRYFLDKVATRTIEIEDGRAETYPGNYTRYKNEKATRQKARIKEYELAKAKYDKEKEYIDRMRAGVNARQAKGREKRLSGFEMPDKPKSPDRSVNIRWGNLGRATGTVIQAEDIVKRFGDTTVLAGASLTLMRGERAAIVGRNGSGKSTLIKVITGQLEPDEGKVTLGGKVKTGYYAQGMEGLDTKLTVREELWGVMPMATELEVRNLLGSFLFSGDDALKKVSTLSGGQMGRLAIAKLAAAGANLLILDEPTNHLDIASREALESAISLYPGTLIAVSHDRYFIDSFADKVFELKNGRLTGFLGNYTYYLEKRQIESDKKTHKASEGRRQYEDQKKSRAEQRRVETEQKRRDKRLVEIEQRIDKIETEIKVIEKKLADPEVYGDYGRFNDLTKCYNDLEDKRDKLYGMLEKELV